MNLNAQKTIDVTALGELLIDFTQNGLSDRGNFIFEANPGGAPCNVLAMLSKLGKKTAFIGKVGDDFLGHDLKEKVSALNIDTSNLVLDKKIPTTLAFIHTAKDGDRSFSFYRNPGADTNLKESEIDTSLIEKSKIFHFGSLSLTHKESRMATVKALKTARQAGCIISFDPNLREPLWNDLDQARKQIAFGLEQCDILKISDNEITWFTGIQDYDEAAAVLQAEYSIPLILVSLGKNGSRAFYNGFKVEKEAFITSDTIETTGAGDTFCACILNTVLEKGLDNLNQDDLIQMLTFANAAASIITTRKGALCVMPSKQEIEKLFKK